LGSRALAGNTKRIPVDPGPLEIKIYNKLEKKQVQISRFHPVSGGMKF
jgi:hypothetical protein